MHGHFQLLPPVQEVSRTNPSPRAAARPPSGRPPARPPAMVLPQTPSIHSADRVPFVSCRPHTVCILHQIYSVVQRTHL